MLCVDPLDSSADSPLTFQAEDAAALLRLYLNFDLLEAAAELVLEYVDALLGRGHQYFGIEVGLVSMSQHALFQLVPLNRLFQRPLSATSSSVWLPYTSIDQLLQALSETQTNASVSLPQSVTSSVFVSDVLCLSGVQQTPGQTGRLSQAGGEDDPTEARGAVNLFYLILFVNYDKIKFFFHFISSLFQTI